MVPSAHTSWRYTLNHAGAMLGWEMSPDQIGDMRPSTRSAVANLHFVGHWAQPGGGITPVIASAMQVASAITASPSADAAFDAARSSPAPAEFASAAGTVR